jgi:hypothetical protein
MKDFFNDHGDALILLVLISLMVAASGFAGDLSARVEIEKNGLTMEKLVGNTAENLTAIKHECEKDLPRNRECVLVYDYVPVDKE